MLLWVHVTHRNTLCCGSSPAADQNTARIQKKNLTNRQRWGGRNIRLPFPRRWLVKSWIILGRHLIRGNRQKRHPISWNIGGLDQSKMIAPWGKYVWRHMMFINVKFILASSPNSSTPIGKQPKFINTHMPKNVWQYCYGLVPPFY